jgi:hypothetical protein
MMPLELFARLRPLIQPRIEQTFNRRDLCVLTTRIVMDVASYFGIEVIPCAVRAIVINRHFAAHVAEGDIDIEKYLHDGSWSVGCGFPTETQLPGKWNAHMIAVAGDYMGDFSIQQAERPERDILTGPAVTGPFQPPHWKLENEHGVIIEYSLHPNPEDYRRAPDWVDKKRRHRIVGDLIRAVR